MKSWFLSYFELSNKAINSFGSSTGISVSGDNITALMCQCTVILNSIFEVYETGIESLNYVIVNNSYYGKVTYN